MLTLTKTTDTDSELLFAQLAAIEALWPYWQLQLDQESCWNCLDEKEARRLGHCDAQLGDPIRMRSPVYLDGYLDGLQRLPRDKDCNLPVFLERPEKAKQIQRYWSEEF